jgi:hypothetical protein
MLLQRVIKSNNDYGLDSRVTVIINNDYGLDSRVTVIINNDYGLVCKTMSYLVTMIMAWFVRPCQYLITIILRG